MYDRLKDRLCEMLEEYEMSLGDNPTMTDLQKVQVLTDTIKNLGKIEMLEGTSEGYSRYSRGNSYANRGKHYVRGHYSRGMDDYDYDRR